MIIISLLLFLIFIFIYSFKHKKYNILLKNELLTNINNEISSKVLESRELMLDICSEINKINNRDLFDNLGKIKKMENTYNLDRKLLILYKDLNDYIMFNKTIVFDNIIENKIQKLHALELDINVYKSFYNDESKIFNKEFDKIQKSKLVKKHNLDYHFERHINNNDIFSLISSN